MAMAFNMLRSNDLIWSYVVNNYLKGTAAARRSTCCTGIPTPRGCRRPTIPSTCATAIWRTGSPPAAWCSTTRCSTCRRSKVPVYNLATREDHIAPADSVLYGSQFFGGPVKYVLSGSGHIAGVVNPPAGGKYQYWTNDNIKDVTLADWLKNAHRAQGLVVARLAAMAGKPRRRARAGARRRLRGAAADRGRARQLRQGPRVAPSGAVRYNQPSHAGTRNRLRGNQ